MCWGVGIGLVHDIKSTDSLPQVTESATSDTGRVGGVFVWTSSTASGSPREELGSDVLHRVQLFLQVLFQRCLQTQVTLFHIVSDPSASKPSEPGAAPMAPQQTVSADAPAAEPPQGDEPDQAHSAPSRAPEGEASSHTDGAGVPEASLEVPPDQHSTSAGSGTSSNQELSDGDASREEDGSDAGQPDAEMRERRDSGVGSSLTRAPRYVQTVNISMAPVGQRSLSAKCAFGVHIVTEVERQSVCSGYVPPGSFCVPMNSDMKTAKYGGHF